MRGFYDLAKAKAPIATETLQGIAALYHCCHGITVRPHLRLSQPDHPVVRPSRLPIRTAAGTRLIPSG
jgi:hypothetical protein